ncbi:MAG: DUF5930 domain-containing protein, partial [Roseobacter sp.]
MRTRLAIAVHATLERLFPERRVFLKSDTDTRFIRLRSETQALAFAGAAFVIAWSIISTSILLMDSIGAGSFREQVKRDQTTYQARLNQLARERDARAEEALAAQERFNAALQQVSVMQSELLASETRRYELETGIDVVQSKLRRALKENDTLENELASLRETMDTGANHVLVAKQDGATPVDFLT